MNPLCRQRNSVHLFIYFSREVQTVTVRGMRFKKKKKTHTHSVGHIRIITVVLHEHLSFHEFDPLVVCNTTSRFRLGRANGSVDRTRCPCYDISNENVRFGMTDFRRRGMDRKEREKKKEETASRENGNVIAQTLVRYCQ